MSDVLLKTKTGTVDETDTPFMEIQAPIHGVYRDVKHGIHQVVATQELLAAKKAELRAATEKMSSVMAEIYDYNETFLKLKRDKVDKTWDQAWGFNTLMDDSVMHLTVESNDVLYPKDGLKRANDASSMNKATASVFENLGDLHQELSRWKSAEHCEYEAEGRAAVRSASHRLQESIQVFIEQYQHYVDQQTSRGNLVSPDDLNVRKVKAACLPLLSEAEGALQSTSNENSISGTSYMRAAQGATSESKAATLQAPEVDHGSEP